MAFVQNGIDVILTSCTHTVIAGGFEALAKGHEFPTSKGESIA